jgi:hypothetical protein
MKFLGKYMAIIVLLGIGLSIILQNKQYILPNLNILQVSEPPSEYYEKPQQTSLFGSFFNLEEGLTVSTPAPQKQGLYTMTNTTYDTNGNIIVKTIDTSGNFNVNTYGSSVLNTKTDQQAKYQQATVNANTPNYQTQFYPPVSNTNTSTTEPVISANQISNMASAAISAAAAAYQHTT